MARIWKVQVNLDEFNNLVGSIWTDEDRALALIGMSLALNGGGCPDTASHAMRTAFQIAKPWREEAERYIERKSEGGKRSAESRKATLGSANPRTNREHIVNTSGTHREHTLNQSTIHNPLTKSTPLPPKGVPKELEGRLASLIERWPEWFEKDGQKIRLPKCKTTSDLYERMVKFNKGHSPEEMLSAGERHLDSVSPASEWDFSTKPKGYTIAMNNFYGQHNRWKEFR